MFKIKVFFFSISNHSECLTIFNIILNFEAQMQFRMHEQLFELDSSNKITYIFAPQ